MHRAIACLIGLGLAAGCAANGGDEGLIVLRNIIASATGGSCVFTGTASETGLAQGALDVSLMQGYEIAPQIKSRITAVTGQEDLRTILVRGANVDITFPNSTVFTTADLADFKSRALTHFMAPFSGFIPPNGGTADIPFEVIPAELAVAVAAKKIDILLAMASFQVVGDLGGGEVTSQTFHFPVTLVNGGFTIDNGPCLLLASSFMPRVGNPCFPGQDGPTDCCSQAGRPLVCPAVGMGQ